MDPDDPTDDAEGGSDPAENRRRLDEWLDDFAARHSASRPFHTPAGLSCPPVVPDGLGDGAWTSSTPDDALAGMDRDLWPEDVLTNEEWNRGWFDRKVLAGELDPEDAPTVPEVFGGTMPNPPGPWTVGTKRPPRR